METIVVLYAIIVCFVTCVMGYIHDLDVWTAIVAGLLWPILLVVNLVKGLIRLVEHTF